MNVVKGVSFGRLDLGNYWETALHTKFSRDVFNGMTNISRNNINKKEIILCKFAGSDWSKTMVKI
jgi:hypothetical protein